MLSIRSLVLAAASLSVVVVNASTTPAPNGLALMVNFNDGRTSSTKYCSTNKMALVQGTVDKVMGIVRATRQRQLRSVVAATNNRGLGWMSDAGCKRCGPYCSYPGTGGCPKTSRRRRQLNGVNATTTTNSANTTTAAPTLCVASQVQAMNAALIGVKALVSSPCKSFIDARSVQCVPSTTNCGIIGIHLINAIGDSVNATHIETYSARHNGTILSFCKSQKVSFHAETDFFIGRVNFVIRGVGHSFASNRTENAEPYYMYGNNGDSIDGKYFSTVGNYSLTITSEYDAQNNVTVAFQTRNC